MMRVAAPAGCSTDKDRISRSTRTRDVFKQWIVERSERLGVTEMRKMNLLSLAAATICVSLGAPALAQFNGGAPGSDSVNARAEVYSKLISTKMPVDFTENVLRDVIQFLSEYSQVDILTKWDEQGFGDGLDPEAQITLHLKNPTTLETILELVMKQATTEETTWSLGDGFIEIGLKDALAQDKYVRLYPIRELLFNVPTFDDAPEMDLESVLGGGNTGEITGSLFDDDTGDSQNRQDRVSEQEQADELIDIITSIVDPLQWEKNGGEGGSMRYFRGSLIVNAADFLHRQVGGYPFAASATRNVRTASLTRAPRYVSLSGRFGFSKIINVEQSEIPVLVGGRVITSGGGGGG